MGVLVTEGIGKSTIRLISLGSAIGSSSITILIGKVAPLRSFIDDSGFLDETTVGANDRAFGPVHRELALMAVFTSVACD